MTKMPAQDHSAGPRFTHGQLTSKLKHLDHVSTRRPVAGREGTECDRYLPTYREAREGRGVNGAGCKPGVLPSSMST